MMINNDPKLGEKISSVPVASDKALPSKRGGGNSSKNSMAPADGMSFISVNAGNSRIKWSFHKPTDWLPYLFWETCHLQQNDTNVTAPETNSNSETSNLVEYLPPVVCNYIFGNDQSFSFEAAKHNLLSEAKSTINFTKEKALLRIYIVSSSMEQTRLLQEQWQRTCPCIVHVLQNSTFCLPSQQNILPYYEGMGTDRVAAVTGARFLYGLPTLVFDAGTALTYTALDGNGNILGGGIGAGIQLSLTSLHKATSGNLPHISLIEQQQKQQFECNLFETNTRGAILTATLEQTLTWVRQVIAGWLHLVGERQNQHSIASVSSTTDVRTVAEYVSSIISGDGKQHKCNNDRNVVFTGGDGTLIQTLLTKRMSSISRPNCGVIAGHDINDKTKNIDSIYTKLLKLNNSIMTSCSTACEDHLIHLGIAYTLLLQSTKKVHNINMPPKDELQKNIVGGQVAKKIRIRSSNDHKNTKYLFGRVIELYEVLAEKESKEMTTKFIISFEDGSRGIVNLEELNGKEAATWSFIKNFLFSLFFIP
jgi:pantothenate kinase type III